MVKVLLPKNIVMYLLEQQDPMPWDTVVVNVKTKGRYSVIDTIMPDSSTLIKYVISSSKRRALETLTTTTYLVDIPEISRDREIVVKDFVGVFVEYPAPYYYVATVEKGLAKYVEVFRIIARYNENGLLEKYSVEKMKSGMIVEEATEKRIRTLKI